MSRARQTVSFVAKSALSIGLVTLLVVRLGVHDVTRSLRTAHWPLLAAAAALLLASNVLGSLQWGWLLRAQGHGAPWRRIVSAYFVGLFFNNFLPANVGGDLARVHRISERDRGLSPTISATLLDRLIGLFVIAAFGVAAIPLLVLDAGGVRAGYTRAAAWNEVLHEPLIYASVVVFFAAAGIALLALRSRAVLSVLLRPIRAVSPPAFAERAERAFASVHALATRGRLLTGIALFAGVVQVMRIYVHFLVAQALDIHLPPAALWAFVPILAVVAALPISLNGLGVREWAATVLLPSVGVSAGAAFAWQLLTYAIAVALSVGGAVLFLRETVHAARPSREPGAQAETQGA